VSDFLFHPGRVVATWPAINALQEGGHNAVEFLKRHIEGDWGTVDFGDAKANASALKSGERLFSVYELSTGLNIWVITDAVDLEVKGSSSARRAITTFLLPEDY
jgi:hypothetical protein